MTDRGSRTLILGGVRSGKSAHGEHLLSSHSSVRYVATGPVLSTDTEWVARVAKHRQRRNERYRTVESVDLSAVLADEPDSPTLVDDLGNWVTATIDARHGWDGDVDLSADIDAVTAAIGEFTADLVLISPEVGLSPVAPTPAGRMFQDALGAVNTAVAAVCDRVLLVVAGRVLELPAAELAVPPTTTPPAEAVAAARPAAAVPAPAPSPTNADATFTDHDPVPTPVGRVSVDPTDAEIFDPVRPPDVGVAEAARERHKTLTKPAGSLGRLEDLGVWIASCQQQCPPKQIVKPTVVVFAGDHGVASNKSTSDNTARGGDTDGGDTESGNTDGGGELASVSAFPSEVTAQMVANIAAGGAAVNVLARRHGVTVRVEDIAVDAETAPEVSRFKVRRSSGDLRVTDAISLAEARTALAAGRAIVDELVDEGVDLLMAGDMGIGNTTPAAAIIGVITHREPVEVVGRGTGIDDHGWMRKTAAIRDGMHRGRRFIHDPLSLLATIGGADFAAMTGFLAQAAVRRTPVILDGVVVTAAAVVAAEMAPGSPRWWVAGHRSTEPAHAIALEHLDLEPLVEMSMRLGEGSGAVLAVPTVTAGVDILTSMATFGEAGVSDRT